MAIPLPVRDERYAGDPNISTGISPVLCAFAALESGEPGWTDAGSCMLIFGLRLRTVTIIPAANERPQGSPATRGNG